MPQPERQATSIKLGLPILIVSAIISMKILIAGVLPAKKEEIS